jgi:hypothetical protein
MEYQDLLTEASRYLDQQIHICNLVYGLDACNRMDYEQETGQMIFSSLAYPKIITEFIIAGSVSQRSNTWLWSWDNPYLLDNVVGDIWKVREYGEQHSIFKLVEPKWNAQEQDGWDMTAIAAYILKAKGAYKFLSDEIISFALFLNIRKAGEGAML